MTNPFTRFEENKPPQALSQPETLETAPQRLVDQIDAHTSPEALIQASFDLSDQLETLTQQLKAGNFHPTDSRIVDMLHAMKRVEKAAGNAYYQLRAVLWERAEHQPRGFRSVSGLRAVFRLPRARVTRKVNWDEFSAQHPALYREWVTESVSTPDVGTLSLK